MASEKPTTPPLQTSSRRTILIAGATAIAGGGGLWLSLPKDDGAPVRIPAETIFGEVKEGKVELALADLPRLKAQNEPYAINLGKNDWEFILLWRKGPGNDADAFDAIGQKCTHAGCRVDLTVDAQFFCNCHGSVFANDGAPLVAPAKRPLPRPKVTIDGDKLVIDLS